MSVCGEHSSIADLVSQSETEYIKEERPEVDYVYIIEDVSHQMSVHPPGLFDKDGNYLERKPHVWDLSSFRSELQLNEHTSILFKYEMEQQSHQVLDELSHEEIEIKVENEDDWETTDDHSDTAANLIRSNLGGNDHKITRSERLEQHHTKQSGQKLVACDQCDYRTLNPKYLRRHRRTHSGEKPFACHQCGFRTLYSKGLQKHQSIHSGEKPFACDQCAFRTLYSDYLKKHRLQHSGGKPFACSQCSYKGRSSRHLALHLRVHAEEKPFACDQCDYQTVYGRELEKHRMRHLRNKSFACDRCSYNGISFGHLRKHYIKHTDK